MKHDHFDKVIGDIPIHVPVFLINRIPHWMESACVKKDDEFFYCCSDDTFIHRKTGQQWAIGVSYVTFSHYAEMRKEYFLPNGLL